MYFYQIILYDLRRVLQDSLTCAGAEGHHIGPRVGLVVCAGGATTGELTGHASRDSYLLLSLHLEKIKNKWNFPCRGGGSKD